MAKRPKEIRTYDFGGIELREHDGLLVVRGHAAVFGRLSLPLGGFRERVAPGAFRRTISQADVRFLAQHDPATVMARTKAGNLTLREDDVGLAVEARLNPQDPDAQRLAVKLRDGNIDQMSFGFEVLDQDWGPEEVHDEWSDGEVLVRTVKEVRLWDVSPVTFPAYPDTDAELAGVLVPAEVRALAEKIELRDAIRPHSTDVVDEPWDGPAAVAAMPNDARTLRYCHAWFAGGDADPAEKQNYKFPHHRTLGGPANVRAVRNGLAILGGARGGADIPEADRAGVERHLRRHLEDANRSFEPADFSLYRAKLELYARLIA